MEPLLERAGQRAAEVERQAAQDIEAAASQQLAEAEASEGFASAAEAAAAGAEAATAAEAGGGALALLGEGALATAGTVGAAAGGLAVAGAGAALAGTAWAIEGGLNAASHMMGWGAATGGGTDSDASRASRATDVQTLNGMQESGAVDHFQVQEMRRQQPARRPQVFQISESDEEPRPQPQQRIVAQRRPRPQVPTPFGLNNAPIPVSSDSDRSRVSRQSRSDRGPLGTQPSFDHAVEERTRTCVVLKGHAERHRSGAGFAGSKFGLQIGFIQCELHSEQEGRSVLSELSKHLYAHHLQSRAHPPDLWDGFYRS